MPDVVFCPAGQRNFASSRLRVWSIVKPLSELGFNVFTPSAESDLLRLFEFLQPDVVVFQKTWYLTALNILRYRSPATKIVFDCDDAIESLPVAENDWVTTDTEGHKKTWPFHTRTCVIPDALDVDGTAFKVAHRESLNKIATVCNAENVDHLRYFVEAANALDHTPRIFTNVGKVLMNKWLMSSAIVLREWDLESIDRHLVDYDLLACPYITETPDGKRDPWVWGKSANRLLKGWGLGLPVAGTPIPSYVEAGLDLAAESVDEWKMLLKHLEKQFLRVDDAKNGFPIANQLRPDAVAKLWAGFLSLVLGEK